MSGGRDDWVSDFDEEGRDRLRRPGMRQQDAVDAMRFLFEGKDDRESPTWAKAAPGSRGRVYYFDRPRPSDHVWYGHRHGHDDRHYAAPPPPARVPDEVVGFGVRRGGRVVELVLIDGVWTMPLARELT